MSTISLTVEAPGQPNILTKAGTGRRQKLVTICKKLIGIAGGEVRGRLTRIHIGTAKASGTLTLSSASGAVGGVINGVTITVTAAGGDTATAALIAAAINASSNALVKDVVVATSSAAVVTITTFASGALGNSVTLAASGTGVTASGTRLAGGTSQVGNL
jgi:hypothetical protein